MLFRSLEWRVRSYLAANCGSCHVPGGPGLGFWSAALATPTEAAGLIHGQLNNPDADPTTRVIVPGDPARSMLLTRLATRGPGQMPPLSSSRVDPQGVALLRRWITNDLPAYQSFPQWQLARFGTTNAAEFFVTLTISITFLFTFDWQRYDLVIALLGGGVIAAPVGAWVAKHVPPRAAVIAVGLLVTGLAVHGLVRWAMA